MSEPRITRPAAYVELHTGDALVRIAPNLSGVFIEIGENHPTDRGRTGMVAFNATFEELDRAIALAKELHAKTQAPHA